MTEVRSGIKNLLVAPIVYDSLQRALGAYAWRRRDLQRYVVPNLRKGARVLDIGCGTAAVVDMLPQDIHYYGFDRNSRYIDHARRKFGGARASFVCDDFTGVAQAGGESFDLILVLGLVHHLDDGEVAHLMNMASSALASDGMLITLDPLRLPGQSAFARFLVENDRGKNVRTAAEYVRLAESAFPSVEVFPDQSPLRLPYSGITLRCSFGTSALLTRAG